MGKRAIAIGNAIAYAIANAIAIAYADAYAYAYADANAIAEVYAIATNATNAANAYANAYAIEYIRKLEELKIFKNVNFTILIDELKKLETEIPDNKQPQEERQKFLQCLQQTLLNAFNLSPDIIDLSKSEAKALENYLYANKLLIQCKQASVQVSPTTWGEIEARMLLVPSNSMLYSQA